MSRIPWTFKFGRLFGIQIRLHILFVFILIMIPVRGLKYGGEGFLDGLGWVFSLYGFVLLHELGHCWAAIRIGSQVESITLWPLGGLATITGGQNRPRETMFVAFAGPAVNLIFVMLIGGYLLAMSHGIEWDPFIWPRGFLRGLFRMNLVLFCFNMLPALPLDGGRILQGAMARSIGFGKSTLVATYVGQGIACVLGLVALYYYSAEGRIFMAIMAIYIFLMAWQERRLLREGYLYSEAERTFGYDFSGGYSTIDPEDKPRKVSWWKRRKEQARRRKAVKAAKDEADMRRRVDELLSKVSEIGMEGLTAAERRFLEEASKKFRSPS